MMVGGKNDHEIWNKTELSGGSQEADENDQVPSVDVSAGITYSSGLESVKIFCIVEKSPRIGKEIEGFLKLTKMYVKGFKKVKRYKKVKGFIDGKKYLIRDSFIDIGRGKFKLSSLNNQLLIVEKVGNVDLNQKYYMINNDRFRRFALKHQSIIPLIGWGTISTELYYVYSYNPTSLDIHLMTSDFNYLSFQIMFEKIFQGILYLNSRKLFLGSDHLYVDDEGVPVFGEQIEDAVVKIRKMIESGMKYYDCIRILIDDFYIKEIDHIISIFRKFLVLDNKMIEENIIEIIMNLEKLQNVLKQYKTPVYENENNLEMLYTYIFEIFIYVKKDFLSYLKN